MKYFLFATFLSLLSNSVFAQDFFIPEGAMRSAVDHLEPLNQELQKQTSNYDQRRYVIRDGRVFAVENEVIPETKQDEEELPSDETETTNVLESQPEQLAENVSDVIEETATKAPQILIDQSLPSYKNRYAQYIEDLKVFQKTKALPENDELNDVLNILSKPQSSIIFENQI